MSLSTKVGGLWKDVSTVHVKVGGVWKPVADGWTKVSGVWKLVYSALQARLNLLAYSASNFILFPGGPAVTAKFTASLIIEGTGPFTYQWYYTGVPSTVTSPTAATFTIRLIDNEAAEASGTVWCEVTDSYGNTVTADAAPWSLALTT